MFFTLSVCFYGKGGNRKNKKSFCPKTGTKAYTSAVPPKLTINRPPLRTNIRSLLITAKDSARQRLLRKIRFGLPSQVHSKKLRCRTRTIRRLSVSVWVFFTTLAQRFYFMKLLIVYISKNRLSTFFSFFIILFYCKRGANKKCKKF